MHEKVLTTKTLLDGCIFRVETLEVALQNGRAARRDVVRMPGACAVVALDAQNRVLLVEQYRVALGNTLLELPAGKLEPGEDPLVCAKRELAEETGATAQRWRKLTAYIATPGFCDEVIHIYLAQDLSFGAPNPDEDEFLRLHRPDFDDALRDVRAGMLCDGKTVAGLLLAKAVLV